ncbi:hypothetical protein HZP71_06430 [Elizabethkingia anophelis]|nr:hypothetical protein [Elizabethkingia anophelis]MCT4122280.1 hypothetical protein [Elizabethkingia anophelis]
MNISKKSRSKAEKKYSKLVGKTEEEINKILYNEGFKKGEDDLHIKKSSFVSTIKLEMYYVDNVALMVTIYQFFLFFFIKESSLIRPV